MNKLLDPHSFRVIIRYHDDISAQGFTSYNKTISMLPLSKPLAITPQVIIKQVR